MRGPERADFKPRRANSRPEKADSRPERADSRPERADFRPERVYYSLERADFRPKRASGGDKRMNKRTHKRKSPVFYKTSSPLGPLPKKTAVNLNRARYTAPALRPVGLGQ